MTPAGRRRLVAWPIAIIVLAIIFTIAMSVL